MNLILSILYAPVIAFALKNFDIKSVCILIFLVSFFWFLLVFKKGVKEYFFSLIYMTISILAFFVKEPIVLKALPATLSLLISTFILYSYINKNSFIFIFLEKFNKIVDEKEKVYIQNSTLFWFIVSILNFGIHLFILYLNDNNIWIFYSSIGWYFIFLGAGLIQFIHKKLVFNRRDFA